MALTTFSECSWAHAVTSITESDLFLLQRPLRAQKTVTYMNFQLFLWAEILGSFWQAGEPVLIFTSDKSILLLTCCYWTVADRSSSCSLFKPLLLFLSQLSCFCCETQNSCFSPWFLITLFHCVNKTWDLQRIFIYIYPTHGDCAVSGLVQLLVNKRSSIPRTSAGVCTHTLTGTLSLRATHSASAPSACGDLMETLCCRRQAQKFKLIPAADVQRQLQQHLSLCQLDFNEFHISLISEPGEQAG